jgi:hypothetical protein
MGKEYNVSGVKDKLRLPVCFVKLLLVEKNVEQLKGLIINERPIACKALTFISVSLLDCSLNGRQV